MYGPTCIFWANLTPFSLQWFELAGSVAANRVITGLFGVEPPLELNSTGVEASSLLRDASTPRGASRRKLKPVVHPNQRVPQPGSVLDCVGPPRCERRIVVEL